MTLNILTLLVLAVGLAMDAFAVSVCKGLALAKVTIRHELTAGIWFGAFQSLMTLGGSFLGKLFQEKIKAFDHWIAFALLALIGINMIAESFRPEKTDGSMSVPTMLVLAVATSIDALAVGVTVTTAVELSVWISAAVIGAVSFVLSAAGVRIGAGVGGALGSRAKLAGGVILILIGVKTLIQHLFFNG